jgi:predicted nucleic acid-binding protein
VNFVDTTVWVGEADANDDFHESSHAIVEGIRTGRTSLAITTDFIVDETVTILGKRRGFGAANASKVAASILASPRVFTVYMDETLLKESLRRYPAFQGKLSFTDVASATVMRKYGVRQIFSHDHDFDKVEGIRRAEALRSV